MNKLLPGRERISRDNWRHWEVVSGEGRGENFGHVRSRQGWFIQAQVTASLTKDVLG